ncbi:hypothetical protein BC830DRAFT_927477 [Chytriomyces sp. MP71]|nr:hypothetical protein BC830DRAFT_927477 [Chytriomyces sp. MP71]
MAATPANDDDVMKFLDGLDDMVKKSSTNASPARAPSGTTGALLGGGGAASAKKTSDVLSFLDELTETKKENNGAASAVAKAAPTIPSPSPVAVGSGIDVAQTDASSAPTNAQQPTPIAETQKQVASAQGWGWAGSLWSTAQAVGSTAVSSLKMAEAMVEETLTSDTVKGLVQDVSTSVQGVVSKESVGKLTQDMSKFAMNSVNTLGDIIAPPIESPSYRGGNSTISHLLFSDASGGNPKLPPISSTITIWLCAELQEEEQQAAAAAASVDATMVPQSPADLIHDFVQATANSLWLHGGGIVPGGSGRAIARRVVVNSVTDPSPRAARGVQEAVKVIEATVGRLQKLADTNDAKAEAPAPNPDGTPVPPNVTLFLIIQPYTTLIPSPITAAAATGGAATALHKHFLTMLLNPQTKAHGLDVVSAVSQSVRSDKGASRLFGGKEMTAQLKGLMDKWSEEQVLRVVEVAVNDVLEEFSLRAKGFNAL